MADLAREEKDEIGWHFNPNQNWRADSNWRSALKRHADFVERHYGPMVECEYRDALRRVVALEPAFRHHGESFWYTLLPQAGHYRRGRADKPKGILTSLTDALRFAIQGVARVA